MVLGVVLVVLGLVLFVLWDVPGGSGAPGNGSGDEVGVADEAEEDEEADQEEARGVALGMVQVVLGVRLGTGLLVLRML